MFELKAVSKRFAATGKLLGSKLEIVAADNVDLKIVAGRNLGIVGESGSGKTTIARIIADIYQADSGVVSYYGTPISTLGKKYGEYRKNVQMVFQDPYNSLNPKLTIRSALADGLKAHITKDNNKINKRLNELMDMVGLSSEHLDRFPNQFSGGQRQRLSLARALSLEPKMIIADEPVSSLDVSVQAQILNLMKQLSREGITFILISHSLAVVSNVCDDIAVMKNGKIIESGVTDEVLNNPQAAYTKSLIEASL